MQAHKRAQASATAQAQRLTSTQAGTDAQWLQHRPPAAASSVGQTEGSMEGGEEKRKLEKDRKDGRKGAGSE